MSSTPSSPHAYPLRRLRIPVLQPVSDDIVHQPHAALLRWGMSKHLRPVPYYPPEMQVVFERYNLRAPDIQYLPGGQTDILGEPEGAAPSTVTRELRNLAFNPTRMPTTVPNQFVEYEEGVGWVVVRPDGARDAILGHLGTEPSPFVADIVRRMQGVPPLVRVRTLWAELRDGQLHMWEEEEDEWEEDEDDLEEGEIRE
ncbi:hypothetical protein HK104_008900 [Borealophlyctis nickersoniae]|nr:hypothetical protein HK104_008900 [Borealophlyctis nickersoniae]